ncbi:hypothetical protein EB001_27295, partial [bacterium]|nr:hypothetical protein [bacterium]
VSISPGVGSVATNGSTTVSPTSTTTYTLSASGPGGSLTLQQTVTVVPPPTVNGFFTYNSTSNGFDYFDVGVNRTPAEISLIFTYSVTFSGGSFNSNYGNSPSGTFTGGNGRALLALANPHFAGTINVLITCPGYSNYTYQMYIANTVVPAPSGSFTASPTSINSGSSSTLSWNISNATSVSISPGVGSVATNGSTTVSPTSTTTYTLSASGSGGSLSSNQTVTVVPPPTVNGSFTYYGQTSYADLFEVNVYRTSEEISNNVVFTYSVTFNGSTSGFFYLQPPSGTFDGSTSGSATVGLVLPHEAGTISISISAPGYTTYRSEMYIPEGYRD